MKTTNYNLLGWVAACLFSCVATFAQAQSYSWANSAGSAGNQDYAYATTADANGNVISVGAFRGTVDFDPSANNFDLVGSTADNGFVAKYDPNGALLWAFKISPATVVPAQVYGATTDAAGNVYVTGRFQGTVDFNPDGATTNNLTSVGGYDMFCAKYDANGNYLWAINMGSTTDDSSQGIVVDNNDNVYLVGMFQASVDFNPSAAVNAISTTGGYDISVAKYDANGAYLSAFKAGGSGSDRGFGIALDGSNNIIITGRTTSSNIDFDPSAATALFAANGTATDAFVAKYDNAGAYQWAHLMGSTGADEGFAVAADAAGNVYAAGRFAISLDADPSASVVAINAVGGLDAYLVKFSSAGAYQAGFAIGGANGDEAQGVAVENNTVYLTGAFDTSADFDPSAGVATLTAAGSSADVFLATYDLNLAYLSAFNVGGTNADVSYDVFVRNGNMYVAGGFQATADFNPSSTATANLVSNGLNDAFVAKYAPCIQPTAPTAMSNMPVICGGGSATLSVTAGSLGSATNWYWYESACSGTSIGMGASITVNPNSTTEYYVRAEGGCVNPSSCALVRVTATANPSVTVTSNNISCEGANNGSISLSAAGSTAPYMYMWSNNATTSAINNLSAGAYMGTVTDANGCMAMANVTITEPTALSNMFMIIDVTCNGDADGSLQSMAQGGTTPYMYMWSNGATSAAINNLDGGSYSLVITDANGCTLSSSAGVNEPTALSAMAMNAVNPTACAAADGQVSTMAMGGVAPYMYNISGLIGTYTPNNSFSGLPAGVYTLGVMDNNGCLSSAMVTLTDPSTLTVTTFPTNVLCAGESNGTAAVSVSGGSPAYNIEWSNGQTSVSAVGLAAGVYNVTVTDANNCSAFGATTITEPASLSLVTNLDAPASCQSCADGQASATVSGGVSPYTYAWSNGSSSAALSGLLTGAYSVTVTDANGCQIVDNLSVTFDVSVAQLAQNAVIAFPNPAQNLLNVQQIPANSQLRLINALGQIVWQQTATDSSLQIDMSQLVPAVYQLQIVQDRKIQTLSIRKQ